MVDATRSRLGDAESSLIRPALDALRTECPGVPIFPTLEGHNAPRVVVNGREVLNFAGYNYLGLAQHPAVLAAAHAAIDRYGTSAGGSRLVSGQNPIHVALEDAIARLLGVDAALVFVGGHATNESVIGHLMGPQDAVFVDELSHNSILEGVKLSGARLVPFAHNKPQRCARLLARSRDKFGRVLVVIEGLYSMDGDVPDLAPFIELRDAYDVALMVDEAHSLGVVGDGRGITSVGDVDPRDVDVLMGTLSKALGSCGGYIAGSENLVEFLRYTTPGFVFSVASPPSVAAAALAAVELIASGEAPVADLERNCGAFHRAASAQDLPIVGSASAPIATLPMESRERCGKVAAALLEGGLLVQPVLYPAVNRGAERLRFFITAMHTEEEIGQAVELVRRVLDEHDATT